MASQEGFGTMEVVKFIKSNEYMKFIPEWKTRFFPHFAEVKNVKGYHEFKSKK